MVSRTKTPLPKSNGKAAEESSSSDSDSSDSGRANGQKKSKKSVRVEKASNGLFNETDTFSSKVKKLAEKSLKTEKRKRSSTSSDEEEEEENSTPLKKKSKKSKQSLSKEVPSKVKKTEKKQALADITKAKNSKEEDKEEDGDDDNGNDSVEQLTGAQWRQKHRITLTGPETLDPLLSFSDLPLPKHNLELIKRMKLEKPTPIQAQAWPIALAGHDFIGIAETGSGKTLAFLLPALVRIIKKKTTNPSVLVLAPTRELAQQTYDVARKMSVGYGFRVACFFGGGDKYTQKRMITPDLQIIVATPGRLMDFLRMGAVDLTEVNYLVLDEADRMLDMGFEPQIKEIVSTLPSSRNTLMFSATWPKEVKMLAASYLSEPIMVTIGNPGSGAKSIKQVVLVCTVSERKLKLQELVKKLYADNPKILCFCNTKDDTYQWCKNIQQMGFKARFIHGDLHQSSREEAIYQFRNGEIPILVATDVAARGLDIKDVKTVINIDIPLNFDSYVHRIGRTGRAGKDGVAYTLFSPSVDRHVGPLISELEASNSEIPPELLALKPSKKQPYRGGSSGRRGGFGGGGGGRFGGGGRGGGRGRFGGGQRW